MNNKLHALGLVLGLHLIKHGAQGHVSLQYPPARSLDLDFLDNSRTVGDCGMESGDLRTSLVGGSQLNLTWHLGYPHPGGYRLTLVTPSTGGKRRLVPSQGDWETGQGKYAQSHLVDLPSETCDDCYLRFERQATNWGPNYLFRSCADIKLVSSRSEISPDCSGAGSKGDNGACVCDRDKLGDVCQYSTGCESDLDCNGPKGQGKCVVLDTAVYSNGKCFCTAGWFGEQCEKKARWSASEATQYNREDYTEVNFGKGQYESSLLWRVIEDEIEMIYEAPTDSWVGLGWKSSDLAWPECQKFPSHIPAPFKRDQKQMDCTDMVIGLARGDMGRVGDFYSRDRSTPREDTFWGGEDDLVSGHAWDKNGMTIVRFIRSLDGGVADHPLRGKLTVVWAYGGWADGKVDDDFYKEDQLKFHGHSRDRIGVDKIEIILPVTSSLFSSGSQIELAVLVVCLLFLVLIVLQIAQNINKKLCGQNKKNLNLTESRQDLY